MEATLADQFRAALALLPDLPDGFAVAEVEVEFQTPKDASHGDLATNVAMQLARPLRRSPRAIADALVEAIEVDPSRVAGVEVAGPGFINIRFASRYLADGLAEILNAGASYGRTTDGAGKTALVEYVSANPTGPLTVAHGRNAVLGDTLATLLDWTGWDVTREYYFNDAGRQMRVLGQSVQARYRALVDPSTPTRQLDDGTVVPEGFPDDGYRGDYIAEVAQTLVDAHGDGLMEAEDESAFRQAAQEAIFADIDTALKRLGVEMDNHFNERDLYESDAVWDVVARLKDAGYIYEKDGATWFKTSELGKTETTPEGEEIGKDVVLVKSTGEPTYRLPDIAYHLNKLERGFDLSLDVFGADHIATYPDVLRGVQALGGDPSKIDVVVYQFVTLVQGGELVKMSTRKATYVTLDELMDEVNNAILRKTKEHALSAGEDWYIERDAPSEDAGANIVRFFFLMRSPNTHLEFDIDAVTDASDKNPVFYLQFAHARIASIERKAGETGLTRQPDADLSLLSHEAEETLIKTLLLFPDEIRQAADARAPHRLATYLRDVATAFNQFYRDCRILGEAAELAEARLALAHAARTVLGNGLAVLGLSAPESM